MKTNYAVSTSGFVETIKSNAKTWGSKIGCDFAEAFELIPYVK